MEGSSVTPDKLHDSHIRVQKLAREQAFALSFIYMIDALRSTCRAHSVRVYTIINYVIEVNSLLCWCKKSWGSSLLLSDKTSKGLKVRT